MANRRGLGRGLGALLGSQAIDYLDSQTKDVVQEIPIRNIRQNRYQPRRTFEPDAMKDLAESIRSYGILQPIIVRQLDTNNYEIIAGERRVIAAKKVGLETIPAVIREYTDAQMREVSLIENIQRQDLSVLEEARAYESLINEFGYTKETLATKIGRSRSHITNLLRLLKLSPQVREWVSAGKISMGQARPLLAIEDADLQVNVAEMVMSEDLSVRKVEAFIKELRNSGLIPEDKPPAPPRPARAYAIMPSKRTNNRPAESPYDRRFREVERKLSDMIGAPIKIIDEGNVHQIQINFSDEGEFLNIIMNLERTFKNINTNTNTEQTNAITSREEKISALRKFSTEGIRM